MIHSLYYYRQIRIEYCLRQAAACGHAYDPAKDTSLDGCAWELAWQDFLGKPVTGAIAKAGKVDIRINGLCYEIKQGSGDLSANTESKCLTGTPRIIYCPVIQMDKPLELQEAWLVEREAFIGTLKEVKLFKVTTSKGRSRYAIETFWNKTKGGPHGAKYYKLVDKLDEVGISLQDFLQTL